MNPPSFRALPGLQFTPHIHGGQRWYAVEDPQNGKFLKLGLAEYLVASGIQSGIGPQQIAETLVKHGFDSPCERVAAIVSWLAKQGLLIPDNPSPAGAAALSSAADAPLAPLTPTSNATPALRFDPFYIRLPLLSGSLVERLAKGWVWLICWPVAVVLCVLVSSAILALVTSSTRFWSLTERLFVEDGRLCWLFAWLLLKTAHEFGHAIAAIAAGSRIRSAGIHLIFLAPVPYVDVTDLWCISNRRHRLLVSAGGMLVEITVAAVAVLIATASSNLTVQYLCAATATLGTITTLAFNANPLVKLDGYYILSDLVLRPNLWTEAQLAIRRCFTRIVNPFSRRQAPPTFSINAGVPQYWLAAYGLASIVYRLVMLLTMAWWVWFVWHGIGILAIAWAAWGWVVRPYWLRRSLHRRASQGETPPGEAVATWLRWLQPAYWVVLGLVLIGVGMLPSPRGVQAPGIVGYGNPVVVRSGAEGVLKEIVVTDRQRIEPGTVLARLDNPQLIHELADLRIEYQISQEQANALRARGELAMLQAEQAKLESLGEHVAQLEARISELEVRAPCGGMVLLSGIDRAAGRFVKPGAPLCMLVSPDRLEIVASASQRDAIQFGQNCEGQVSVVAVAGSRCVGKLVSVDTRGSDVCEQQALAARYGGPLDVELSHEAQGETQLKFPQPRFEIKADLPGGDQTNGWMPGQMVWIRLDQSSQRLWQWAWEAVSQTLHKRAGEPQ